MASEVVGCAAYYDAYSFNPPSSGSPLHAYREYSECCRVICGQLGTVTAFLTLTSAADKALWLSRESLKL